MKIKQIFPVLLAILILSGCGDPSSGGKKPNNNNPGGNNSGNNTSYESVDMMTLTPLKDQFASYFLIGNIATRNDTSTSNTGTITNQRLTRHYNVLTAENDMKPDSYGNNANSLVFTNADRFVNSATNSGFKIIGHTLLWHSQIPEWQSSFANNSNETTVFTAMRKFITDVMTRYKGKIYSWDVLNEVFPDSGYTVSSDWKTVMRTNNPWYGTSKRSNFVYEGFKAARLADSNAILYYNDYNLNETGKATMVRNMVRDVNQQWQSDPQYDGRKLIEGIGMQSHHNINVSANSIKASLDLFRPLGVKISISELDILSQSWSEYSSNATPTENGKQQAANLYGEYFKLFIQNKDIIERVTFWGVYDEQSWRARAKPLLFEGSSVSKSKPAYYKVIGALK